MSAVDYTVIESRAEARKVLAGFNNQLPTFCDIETSGLYGYTRLIQLTQDGNLVYIIDMDYQDLNEIKELLKPLHTVWYNASYDLGTLNMVTDTVDDLFYLAKTAFPNFMKFNLDTVTSKLYSLGKVPNLYKDLDKSSLQKKGFLKGAYLSVQQLKYSATDVVILKYIWDLKEIQHYRSNLAYKVDIISLKYAIQYQQNGLVVDIDFKERMYKKDTETIAKLRELVPWSLNVNSPKQVKEFLGTDKADRETLTRLALEDPSKSELAEAVIELKKATKRLSYMDSLNHPIMFTKFNVAGAITGRFTSSGGDLDDHLNAQQIPRILQPIFNGDTDDTAVIDLDYSTLELRLACAIYNEPNMYEVFKDGGDIHTETAKIASGKELHPDGLQGSVYDDKKKINTGKYLVFADREKAKAVNFGYVFGMSAKTYMDFAFVNYGIKLTLAESTKLRDAYFRKFPGLAKYHKYVWDNVKKPNFVYTTALGRRVKPKMGTDGINGPVQGSGAECTKLAVHYLIKEYPESINYIYNVVHDAIYIRVPKQEKAVWETRLRSAMLKGWTELSKSKLFHFNDIPMPMD